MGRKISETETIKFMERLFGLTPKESQLLKERRGNRLQERDSLRQTAGYQSLDLALSVMGDYGSGTREFQSAYDWLRSNETGPGTYLAACEELKFDPQRTLRSIDKLYGLDQK